MCDLGAGEESLALAGEMLREQLEDLGSRAIYIDRVLYLFGFNDLEFHSLG